MSLKTRGSAAIDKAQLRLAFHCTLIYVKLYY